MRPNGSDPARSDAPAAATQALGARGPWREFATEPLPHILRKQDLKDRILSLATLLEGLLGLIAPGELDEQGRPLTLMPLVRRRDELFSSAKRVVFGLKIRNRLAHPSSHTDFWQMPRAADALRDAERYLQRGVYDLLEHVPSETRRRVLDDPHGIELTKSLREIEQSTNDPIQRLVLLRDRLAALLTQIDVSGGFPLYQLGSDDPAPTAIDRFRRHHARIPGIVPSDVENALTLAMDAEQQRDTLGRMPYEVLSRAGVAVSDAVRKLELDPVLEGTQAEAPPAATPQVQPNASAPAAPPHTSARAAARWPWAVAGAAVILTTAWATSSVFRSQHVAGVTPVPTPIPRTPPDSMIVCRDAAMASDARARSAQAERLARERYSAAVGTLARAREAERVSDYNRAQPLYDQARIGFDGAAELADLWSSAQNEQASMMRELERIPHDLLAAEFAGELRATTQSAAAAADTDDPAQLSKQAAKARIAIHRAHVAVVKRRLELVTDPIERMQSAHDLLALEPEAPDIRERFNELARDTPGWWLGRSVRYAADVTERQAASGVWRFVALANHAMADETGTRAALSNALRVLDESADQTAFSLTTGYFRCGETALSVGQPLVTREAAARCLDWVPRIPNEQDRAWWRAWVAGLARRSGDDEMWQRLRKTLGGSNRRDNRGNPFPAFASAAAGDFAEATRLSDDYYAPSCIAFWAAKLGDYDVYRQQCNVSVDVIARGLGIDARNKEVGMLKWLAWADIEAHDFRMARVRMQGIPSEKRTEILESLAEGLAETGQTAEAEGVLAELKDAPLPAIYELSRQHAVAKPPSELAAWLESYASLAVRAAGYAGAASHFGSALASKPASHE